MSGAIHPWLFPLLLAWSALWAGASLLALDRLRLQPSACSCWRGFWLMSGLWAVVNVLIAASGIAFPVEDAEAFARVLRINVRLDLVYLVLALVLGLRKTPLLQGFGIAIGIQGLFLLGFDLFWLRHPG